MSGGYPLFLDACNGVDYGSNTSGAIGTGLTVASSNNTKSSYTQLISSTTNDASYMMINIVRQSFAVEGLSTMGVDIAIGAAASEKVIVQNLVFCGLLNSGEDVAANILIPIQIPSGTRISARYQLDAAGAGSPEVFINIQLFDSGFFNLEGVAGVDSVGFSTSTSKGTAVTPGATADTKGSYAQLISSTTRDYIGFFLGFDEQSGNDLSTFSYLMDLAIGGSGSEKVIIPNMQLNTITTSTFSQGCQFIGYTPIFPISIPSGTRIAARLQTDATSATALGMTLYGLYQ